MWLERAMCKILVDSGFRSQAPLKLAITDIDPECGNFGDSDLQFLLGNRDARRCDLCPPAVAKKCDRAYCCMDFEYSGSC